MLSLSTLIAFFIRAAFDTYDHGDLDVVDKKVPLKVPIGTSPSLLPPSSRVAIACNNLFLLTFVLHLLGGRNDEDLPSPTDLIGCKSWSRK
ncbi:hypothetical protein D8674_008802 [Pyrus ussuriensis x Pyrus communis]|uniref:Uncharacterized protein n=1 Tax=Pyrus ussuriensis x Pyrus communis TaxID=2448454 RepID=A0A5N5HWV7_9ROSA|nr:hypothetical protein D8674_008802 [Pyrus ussuriensis x Pyrus communis]